jgi:hypothetical protein
MITAPIKAKANAADVKSLIDGLKDLKITEAIDRTEGAYEAQEVTDAKGVHFTTYEAGGGKKLDLIFGKKAGRGQMLRVVGTPGVYVDPDYQTFLLTKDVKGWRDKSIMKLNDADVASIEIENENGKYVFTKSGDNWDGNFEKGVTSIKGEPKEEKKDDKRPEGDKKADDKKAEGDKKDGADKKADDKKAADKKDDKKADKKDDAKKGDDKKAEGDKKDAKKDEPKAEDKKPGKNGFVEFDGKKVEDMLRALKSLNAIDFADDGADTGTESVPTGGIVRIKMKDGTTYVILLGKKQKGSNRFVKKPDDPTVWVVSSWAADWITAEPSKFEKKADKKPGGKDAPPDGEEGGDDGAPDMDLDMPPGMPPG